MILERPSRELRPFRRHIVWTGFVAAMAVMPAAAVPPQRSESRQPIPVPAVMAFVDAFHDHRLVAVGEVHRNEQLHGLIRSLLNDTRFLPNGGDIVVEFGNGRYQELMDRFTAGEDIRSEELARVWRETVNILVWDAPVYEQVFRTVRSVNQVRESGRRLRVVLADPPIDWNGIRDRAAWEEIAATRDRHAADVIEREVLNRGHSGLLIFGSGHVQNENAFGRFDKRGRIREPNLAELLQREHPGITFFVVADWMSRALDARLAGWRAPAMVRLKGTWLGNTPVGPPGTPRFEDLADAFLYLGPTASLSTSTPSPAIYRDRAYLQELIRRDGIQGGANASELQRLSARFLDGKSPRP
jgi:hypothetical protein